MKTTFIALIAIIALSLSIMSCKKDKTETADIKPVQLTQKQKQLLDKSNNFGFEFFKTAIHENSSSKNMMISPLSVSMALGMTRNGAATTTLEAMNSTLGFNGMVDAGINDSYKYILETFTNLDPKVKLSIANSIWYRDTFTVEDTFVATNKNYFNAAVTPLDFNNPTAVDIINNWVSENTNALIPKIIDEISGDNIMFLINAVYFKGQWKYQFDEKNSALKPFYLSDGSQIEAQSMVQHADVPYFENSTLKAIELPYNQGNYVMTVVVPKETKTLSDVADSLSQSATWNFTTTNLQVQLPKFKFEYSEPQMLKILTDMGMGVAFSPELADFTRINSGGNLYISDIKHKTFIETNEEGTEAAAVTSTGMSTTSINPNDPLFFTVDKPFIFYISEKSTGSILFIGSVLNPTEN